MSLTVWLEFRLPATPVILLIAYSFILEEPNWHDSAYFDFTLFIVYFGLIYCTYWCLIVLTLISSPRGLRGALSENFLFEVKSKYGQNALQMQRGILVSKEVHPQSLEVSLFVFWVDPCHAILDFQDHSPRVQDWIIMSLPLLCAGILLHFLGDYSLNLIKDDVVGGDHSHIVQKEGFMLI